MPNYVVQIQSRLKKFTALLEYVRTDEEGLSANEANFNISLEAAAEKLAEIHLAPEPNNQDKFSAIKTMLAQATRLMVATGKLGVDHPKAQQLLNGHHTVEPEINIEGLLELFNIDDLTNMTTIVKDLDIDGLNIQADAKAKAYHLFATVASELDCKEEAVKFNLLEIKEKKIDISNLELPCVKSLYELDISAYRELLKQSYQDEFHEHASGNILAAIKANIAIHAVMLEKGDAVQAYQFILNAVKDFTQIFQEQKVKDIKKTLQNLPHEIVQSFKMYLAPYEGVLDRLSKLERYSAETMAGEHKGIVGSGKAKGTLVTECLSSIDAEKVNANEFSQRLTDLSKDKKIMKKRKSRGKTNTQKYLEQCSEELKNHDNIPYCHGFGKVYKQLQLLDFPPPNLNFR